MNKERKRQRDKEKRRDQKKKKDREERARCCCYTCVMVPPRVKTVASWSVWLGIT